LYAYSIPILNICNSTSSHKINQNQNQKRTKWAIQQPSYQEKAWVRFTHYPLLKTTAAS